MDDKKDINNIYENNLSELNEIFIHAFDEVYIASEPAQNELTNQFYTSGFINYEINQHNNISSHITLNVLTNNTINNDNLCRKPIFYPDDTLSHSVVITDSSSILSAKSIKPTNIILNFRKLISSLPEIITESFVITADVPLLKICAALRAWKVVKNIMTVDISRQQAIVIYSLWKNCDQTNKITLDSSFVCTNALAHLIQTPEFTWDEFIVIIEELCILKCITIDENYVELIESVSMANT